MSNLTEKQHEELLQAGYDIGAALTELSAFNHLEATLGSIDSNGLKVIKATQKAIKKLRTAKTLCQVMINSVEGLK